MSTFTGKNVLITGGASGIGRLMALTAAKKGARVMVCDINNANLETISREFMEAGLAVSTYHCDVSDRQAVYALAEQVKEDAGSVDILINNAGVVTGKSFLESSDEQNELTMKVNVLAHFWTVKAFLPAMLTANSGHIVTIASAGGIIGVNRLADYSASKFAAFGFDESLRMELKARTANVRTTVVCPFFINTGMFAGVRTRFPWLLPVLDEDYVASRIIHAVERNKPRLVMPWIVYSIWFLRFLPVTFFDALASLLGINSAMDSFKGRGNRHPQ